MNTFQKLCDVYETGPIEVSDIFLRNIVTKCDDTDKKIKHLIIGYSRLLSNNKKLMESLSIKSMSGTTKIKKKYSKRNLFKFNELSLDVIDDRHALACSSSEIFFRSHKWKAFRFKMFQKLANCCVVCKNETKLHLDHIKPRSLYPELAFNENNVQILCEACNLGKGATTFRPKVKVRKP